jgi:hypothetical protein
VTSASSVGLNLKDLVCQWCSRLVASLKLVRSHGNALPVAAQLRQGQFWSQPDAAA